MKTVRFQEVVKRFGAPVIHLLWGPPEKDTVLQSAVKKCRVMTIQQPLHGGKKDFGSVGFFHEPHAQILVFPKPLKGLGDARVVGIDFELVAKNARPYKLPPPPKPKKPVPPPPAPEPPAAERPAIEPRDDVAVSEETPAPSDEPAEPRPKSKPVASAQPTRTPPPSPAPPSDAIPASAAKEIQKALRELKAGKTVAAYERLSALVNRS